MGLRLKEMEKRTVNDGKLKNFQLLVVIYFNIMVQENVQVTVNGTREQWVVITELC